MAANVDENSKIIQAFKVFQSELDQKHDKHERIVKLSRDVTIESKRVIFLLQRLSGYIIIVFTYFLFLFYLLQCLIFITKFRSFHWPFVLFNA